MIDRQVALFDKAHRALSTVTEILRGVLDA